MTEKSSKGIEKKIAEANIHFKVGNFGQALEILDKIENQVIDLKPVYQAIYYHLLGIMRHSLDYLRKSLKIAVLNRLNEQITGSILNSIGDRYFEKGNFKKALSCFKSALKFSKKSKSGKASIMGNIAILYFRLGNKKKAMEYIIRTSTLFEEVGNLNGKLKTDIILGDFKKESGDIEGAISAYFDTFKRALEANYSEIVIDCLIRLGFLYEKMGNFDVALQSYNDGINVALSKKFESKLPQFHTRIASVKLLTGDFFDYKNQVLMSLFYNKKYDKKIQVATNYVQLAHFEMYNLNFTDAEDFIVEAQNIYETSMDKKGLISVYETLGKLEFNRGNLYDAKEFFEKGIDEARKIDFNEAIFSLKANLLSVYLYTGEIEQIVEKITSIYEHYLGQGDKIAILNLDFLLYLSTYTIGNKNEFLKKLEETVNKALNIHYRLFLYNFILEILLVFLIHHGLEFCKSFFEKNIFTTYPSLPLKVKFSIEVLKAYFENSENIIKFNKTFDQIINGYRTKFDNDYLEKVFETRDIFNSLITKNHAQEDSDIPFHIQKLLDSFLEN